MPIADFERLAPVPFSVVCFRARPRDARRSDAELDALNDRLLQRSMNPARSSCRTRGSTAGWCCASPSGHLRTTDTHVARAWDLLRLHLEQLQA